MKSNLHKALSEVVGQIGERYLPRGMKLYDCHIHGLFLAHYTTPADKVICPICAIPTQNGNGTTATQIEHYIDLKHGIDPTKDRDGF